MPRRTDTLDQRNLDHNARVVTNALQPLVEAGEIRIPRGGYIVRLGHGKLIVQRSTSSRERGAMAMLDGRRK